MAEVSGNERVTRTRRAALSRTGLRQLATTTATIAVADMSINVSPAALPVIVDAILQATDRWLTLQGLLLAADRLDNLITDTQHHLVNPAAERAENNPDYRDILRMHQQYVDGMREALTQIGSVAEHTLNEARTTTAGDAFQTSDKHEPGRTAAPILLDHSEAR